MSPFAWIKRSTYNTAKWYKHEMDFEILLRLIENKELDIPNPEDDDIWWITYALRHGGQIVTNDKFKDKYVYEKGRRRRMTTAISSLENRERTKHPELPWDITKHGDASIDARTYRWEFIPAVGKEVEPQSFHSPIPKYGGGVIPAESDPRDEVITNLRGKNRSLEKENRYLITKLATTMNMDFNGHENEIVDVWERSLADYEEVSCNELFLAIARKILHLKGQVSTWPKSWKKDVRRELVILEDMSIILLETKERNVKFDNERTSVIYLR